jgi:hypothetical protein
MVFHPSGLLLLPLPAVECCWIDAECDPESESVPKTIPMGDYGEGE